MNMFKKDDYIVVLKDSSCENNWQNFVVKQIKNYNAIMPVITPLGKDNSDCDHSYSSFIEKDNVWRYADEEEIEEYKRLGKPFDTSKFKKFILPENWHIVVTEENAEDVLKWRFDESYNYKDKTDQLNNLVGMVKDDSYEGYSKGHNLKGVIVGDTYDFGIEITYQQFKEHVLKQSPVKHLTELLEKLKVE